MSPPGGAGAACLSAVVWDMGGILYRYFTEMLIDLGAERGWPLERLPLGPTGPGPDSVYEAMDRGELTEPEYVSHVEQALAREGIAFSLQGTLRFVGAERVESWAAIEKIKGSGRKQGLLTNDATLWLGERWWETWPLAGAFDAVLDVRTLGVRKPAPEPYLACARALNTPAAQCLFVDDMRANCRGAEGVGMQSHWFDIARPGVSAAALLERLGLV